MLKLIIIVALIILVLPFILKLAVTAGFIVFVLNVYNVISDEQVNQIFQQLSQACGV